jgi:hypothetical protein
MSEYLSFEHGIVTLGETTVPGILKSQSIKGSVRFDEAEQDGLSGKTKIPMGFEDSDINLVVELLTDTDSDCYEKLSALNSLFKTIDEQNNPVIYKVLNPHIAARGIRQVVFSGLESSESDENDIILANISFTEHEPAVLKVEKRGSALTPEDTINVEPEADPEVTQDIEVDVR